MEIEELTEAVDNSNMETEVKAEIVELICNSFIAGVIE